ncbi:MAG: carboxypeptidase-like regulatory domain-containing protein [Saprospiraceae bacterium]
MKSSSNLFTYLTILFLSFSTISVNGQCKINGTVTNKVTNEPITSASIFVKGTKIGTTTDVDGKYELTFNCDSVTLIVFYVGFESIEKTVVVSEITTQDFLLKKLDAEYEMITKTILKTPASTRTVEIPAEYSTVTKQVETSPGVYKTVTETVLRKAAGTKVVGTPAEYETVTEFKEVTGTYRDIGESSTKGSTSKKDLYQARQLTAGEIHDFSKWEMWQDISKNQLNEWQKRWNMAFSNRYTVQVMNKNGIPIIDSKVELLNGKKLLWTAKTDNTGKAELWTGVFGKENIDSDKLTILVTHKNLQHKIKKVKQFKEGINFLKIRSDCQSIDVVDVMFVVDATASMSDEILYLKTELEDVINQMQTKTEAKINLGSVFYRDSSDSYLTRKSILSTDIPKTISFINKQHAIGGGDRPEAVDAGLDMAINQMKWSENASARLLFIILDAPPHHNPEVLKNIELLTKKAAEKGIRIIPLTASGIGKSTEYLMRSLALSTNGTYTFLTNHSGIGNNHIAPTTDNYKVELLNDLLVRLFVQYTQTIECKNVEVDSLETFELKPMQVLNTNIVTTDSIPSIVNCFPNPTKGQLTIETNKAFDEVFITDANGKIIQRHLNLEIGNNRINLDDFPSGLYYLRYIKNGKSGTKQIVLVH